MEAYGNSKPIVLITGSSGLIGRAIAARLGSAYQIVGFDLKPPGGPSSKGVGVDFYSVDISSTKSVRDALKKVQERWGGRLASVIHLAAYYSFSGESSPKYDQITVAGTRRLLRGLQEFDFEVEQFVFSSTMLVHAPGRPGRKIDESWPVDPSWAYPASKVHAESVIREQNSDIPYVILRISGVYTDRCQSIPLANHIARIYERQLTSHFFPGDTSHGQSFLHLDDLVDAFARVVERRQKLSRQTVLLLGEPEALSYHELQEEIARLIHGESWRTLWVPPPAAKAGAWMQAHLPVGREPFIKPWMIEFSDVHYDLDVRRAREVLGWSPRHRLYDTLPKMIEALKADPMKWYRENKIEPPRRAWRFAKSLGGRRLALVTGSGLLAVLAYRSLKNRRTLRGQVERPLDFETIDEQPGQTNTPGRSS